MMTIASFLFRVLSPLPYASTPGPRNKEISIELPINNE